ncbi:histidine phosphatase family protein [Sphingomonas aracearum]|uniref:Histidine phosphatase family protein n=1 Tax=Sphingomonas aracearum TaxID=2283317 RepID=A0A369VWN9_9SPHN|nr:histidine phosphatase family protein [Sphingomonas aracearum]RDE06758.1 histidine phosphatase family protein [Sphingomonas aracearum]
MKTILLARHATHAEVGHVLSGRSEIPLSDAGRQEARALTAMLAAETIAEVHASPRRRTQETAAAVAAPRGLPVRTAPALDEVDFGAFAGRSFASLDHDPDWFRWNAERGSFRCPGGETMAEAADRALAYLHALPDQASPALLVSHCDVIRGLVCRALGAPLERMFSFDCAPASLTRLTLDGSELRVVSLNERAR